MGLRPVLPALTLMLVGTACNASSPSPDAASPASPASAVGRLWSAAHVREGATPAHPTPFSRPGWATAAGNPPQGPQVSDAAIAAVLGRELQSDAVVGREPVRFASDRGIVTLAGALSNQLARDRALDLAQVAIGVRAIIDRLTVVLTPRSDDELGAAATVALAADPTLSQQRVTATAREGVVHIGGSVASIATMRIAESDVLQVPGVHDVADELAVTPFDVAPTEDDDARLAAEIQRTMRDDPWLNDDQVQVKVHAGIVLVTGCVWSAAERARAEADARESAPSGVDFSALRIDTQPSGTLRGTGPVQPRDEELREALFDAYARDPRLSGFYPHADVRDGVVVLAGIAPSAEAARAAFEDARNVRGVANTHGTLDSPTVVPASDAVVMTRVRAAFDREPRLSSRKVTVAVDHGHVTLGGRVMTESDRRRALDVANGTAGVLGVDDTFVVFTASVAEMQP